MAKKGLNIRYKSRKRERNKYNPTINKDDGIKSFGKNLLGVAIFLGVMGLMVFGMSKIGVFDRGYTAPEEKEAEFDYVNIPIGTVFNRSEKTYWVFFDEFENDRPKSTYINSLLEDLPVAVYKVNMSRSENAKYKGETANKTASKSSELSINDVTLIGISNGKIVNYFTGRAEIEAYLEK